MKNIVLYFILWSIVTLFYIFLFSKFFVIDKNILYVDAIFSHTLLSFFGLSIWYIVRYQNTRETSFEKIIPILSSIIFIFLLVNLLDLMVIKLAFTLTQTANVQIILFKFIYTIIIYALLFSYYYIQYLFIEKKNHELAESSLYASLKESELKALKAQINPHFLFNCLNSASALTIIDPPKAQEMIIKLAEYFRYNIQKGPEKMVTIEEEIENCLLYLDIEKIRFGNKLLVEKDISIEHLSFQIPALILQPLFENAVKYGIYENDVQSKITFQCTEYQNYMHILLINPFIKGIQKIGTGNGLKLVSQRLKTMYNNDVSFDIKSSETQFEVSLKIPKQIAL